MNRTGVRVLIFSTAIAFVFLSLDALAGGDPLTKLAKQLVSKAGPLKSKRVAILAFPYHDGKISSGSSVISERLTTDFVGQRTIRVVERRLIQKLLEERHLNEVGAIDPQTAKMIGQVLDAEVIVTGTLIDLENNQTEVNARLIRSETGEILSAAKTTIERTWDDNPRSIDSSSSPLAEPVMQEKPAQSQASDSIPEDERQDFRRTHAKPTAAKGLRLSNENLPQGNFIYTSPSGLSGGSRLRFPNPSYNNGRNNPDEDYGSGYDDGYWDGRVEAEGRSRMESQARRKQEEPASNSSNNIIQQRLNRYNNTSRHSAW